MKKEVLIVGAGPAGLMAALSLAKAGHHATVIEQKTRSFPAMTL